MPRLPSKVSELLTLCGSLVPVWEAAAPGSLGLLPADISSFKAAVLAANGAVADQFAAKESAKEATITANKTVRILREEGADAIRKIDAFALASADPEAVFAAAHIPAPQPRTPSQPPGQPSQVTATLDDQGNVTLKWKCTNPPGGNVVYTIGRSMSATGPFTPVGVSGRRSFTDETIPGGSTAVFYTIRGLRGQTAGPVSATFVLRFGQGGGGFTIASQGMAPTSGKLAA